MIVDAGEFVGVKSFKAKGKRLTTFAVDKIEELEPIIREEEPEVQSEADEVENNDVDTPNEDDGQMKLF